MPPLTRRPSTAGAEPPSPNTNHSTTTTTAAAPSPYDDALSAGRPVRSLTARRHFATTRNTIAAAASTTTALALPPSNQNTLEPRTFNTAIDPSVHDSFGGGKALSTTAVYSSTIKPYSGTLRMISTYAWAALRTMKFFERRATPRSTPSTVASTTPVTARRKVLRSPSTRASLTGCVGRNSLPAMGKLAGWSR